KVGPSFQPYQDAKERARIGRIGYRRVSITAVRPTESRLSPGGATAAPAPGGLPPDLGAALIVKPLLPSAIGGVFAPAEIGADASYSIEYACLLSGDDQQLGAAQLYVKGSEVYIVTDFERLAGGLAARTRQNLISLTFPPDALEAGRYHITLLGQAGSRAWTVQAH